MVGRFDFNNPALPEDCVGRTLTLDDIDNQIRETGSNVRLILGGRNCGKSTVLNAVTDRLTKRLKATLDGHTAESRTLFIPIRVSLKMREFQQADDVLGFLTYYSMLATHGTCTPGLEFPVLPLDLPELGQQPVIPVGLEHLEQTIRAIVVRVNERYQLDTRIVLLMDDVQYVLGKDFTPTLFARLHSLAKSGDVHRVIRLVLAGPQRMISQETVGSPLFTAEPQSFCDALERDAILEIIGWAEGLPDDVVQLVAHLSGGHAYILQYLLANLCMLEPVETTTDFVETIAAALASRSQSNIFESWWEDLSGIGQRVYKEMCALSPLGIERVVVNRMSLIKKVGATPLEVKAGLEELQAHGLICKVESGKYLLGTALFRMWLEHSQQQLAPAPGQPSDAAPPTPMSQSAQHHPLLSENGDDFEALVEIIARLAMASSLTVEEFFRDLLKEAALPERYRAERAGWTADIGANARQLVTWAESKGANPVAEQYTTLGSIVRVLYSRVGSDKYLILTRLVRKYGLYLDVTLLENLETN